MAKGEKALSDSFRARGVRKKVAAELARAANGTARPHIARVAASDLAAVVAEVQRHLDRGEKQASSHKAAHTRKHKARLRSESAKKAARSRARG